MLYEDNSITITQKNTFKELARKDLLEAHVRSYVRLLNGEYLSVSDLKRKSFVKITWPNELWIAQVVVILEIAGVNFLITRRMKGVRADYAHGFVDYPYMEYAKENAGRRSYDGNRYDIIVPDSVQCLVHLIESPQKKGRYFYNNECLL